ncbi:helix-turn-helix domain-containing protein [Asaia bogorensis]|uniref:helix-turn-helix domain-containing protein n=1 Tax=Asaia bogorensis TaxID=91915 RepID=UPI000EFCFED7|nr:helix-turn-helix domain-containing protein [Asaia bogorensis]
MPDKTTDRIPGWQGSAGEGARGVGLDLRARREELGWALPDVAGWLRIRESYLLALEEGNMAVFPGSAYALGFLRTYAQAVGMDPDQAVARFRHDTRGAFDRKTELSFPEPVSERGVPVGLWVGAGLAVLVGTYIGYYHFFGSEPAPAHQMPPVAEIMPGVTQHGTTSPQIAAVMPEQGLAPSPQTSSSQVTGAAPTASSAATSQPPVGTGVQQGVNGQTPVANVTMTGQVPSASGAETQPASTAPAPMPGQIGSGSNASPQTAPDQGTTGHGNPTQNAASTAVPLPGGATAPSSVVAANMIGLHAAADAWVSIRDRNGATVFSRVLKSGETWQGPADAGPYHMTLGNAGGLTLSAGDVTTSALGRVGAVRRNLVVTADAIRNGQLGQDSSGTAASAAPVAPVTHIDANDAGSAPADLKNTVATPKVTAPVHRASPPASTSHESETDRLNARQLEQTAQPR